MHNKCFSFLLAHKCRETLALLIFFIMPHLVFLCLCLGLSFSSSAPTTLSLRRSSPTTSIRHFVKGQTLSLGGSLIYLGEYYVPISIGGQIINVQVDTGSSALAFPAFSCSPSPYCGSAPNLYMPSKSATYQAMPCDQYCQTCGAYNGTAQCSFRESFGDGSAISGVLAGDRVSLGNFSTMAMFGMILTESQGFSSPEVPGILGVAMPSLDCNPTCVVPLLDKLNEIQNLSLTFGMCLSSQGGGAWDLGCIEPSRAMNGQLFYTPLITSNGYFEVSLLSVYSLSSSVVSSTHQMQLQSAITIVDSGTTLLVVPQWFFDDLQTFLMGLDVVAASDLIQGSCVCLTALQVQQYPVLFFNFPSTNSNDVTYVPLGPQDYLLSYQGVICLGIQAQSINMFILGDVFMQSIYTTFDRPQAQIGFATLQNSSCDGLVTSNAFLTSCSGGGSWQTVQMSEQVGQTTSAALPVDPVPLPSPSPSPSPSSSSSSDSSSSSSSSLSITDITVVAVIGSLVGLLILALTYYFLRRRLSLWHSLASEKTPLVAPVPPKKQSRLIDSHMAHWPGLPL